MKVNDIFKTTSGYYSYVYMLKSYEDPRFANELQVWAYSCLYNNNIPKLVPIASTISNYFRVIELPEDINTPQFREMLVSIDPDARNYAIEIIKQYDDI